MSRLEEVKELNGAIDKKMEGFTPSIAQLMLADPKMGTSVSILTISETISDHLKTFNETMAMIYDDIHTNPSPYTISNLRADMMARGATAQELATLSDLVKKYKGE